MNVNLSNFYSTSVSTSPDGFDGSAEAEVKQILKIGAVKRDTRKYKASSEPLFIIFWFPMKLLCQ
jgi:hypothetical protein